MSTRYTRFITLAGGNQLVHQPNPVPVIQSQDPIARELALVPWLIRSDSQGQRDGIHDHRYTGD